MTITEIIAPDGTLLLAERIPKRAAFVVLDRFQDGDWRVWTTHTTEALARRAFRKAEKYLRHNEHVVAVIPGRICATCHGTGAVKRDERYFDCADCGGKKVVLWDDETGTSGYEQAGS